MELSRAHIVGDDVNTDYIIASRYKARADDATGLTAHLFEDLDPALAARIQPGDVIVAGHNFGSGSSRETAPRVLKAAGVSAVVARSFARIFFRNAINVGLAVIESDWNGISTGDRLCIEVESGSILAESGTVCGTFAPLPPFLIEIVESGGLRGYLRKRASSEAEQS